eukprot:gene10644-14268_t
MDVVSSSGSSGKQGFRTNSLRPRKSRRSRFAENFMASAAEQLASNLNFSTFAKAEDLKKRLWFTLAALLVYRLGTHIPLPGLNPEAYAAAFQGQSGGILGLFNMFSGGAV